MTQKFPNTQVTMQSNIPKCMSFIVLKLILILKVIAMIVIIVRLTRALKSYLSLNLIPDNACHVLI